MFHSSQSFCSLFLVKAAPLPVTDAADLFSETSIIITVDRSNPGTFRGEIVITSRGWWTESRKRRRHRRKVIWDFGVNLSSQRLHEDGKAVRTHRQKSELWFEYEICPSDPIPSSPRLIQLGLNGVRVLPKPITRQTSSVFSEPVSGELNFNRWAVNKEAIYVSVRGKRV